MEHARISTAQRQRTAVVYVRQSSPTQLERNPESTTRQYQLVARAHALGWAPALVQVIDEDLGRSASGIADRAGFAHLTAEVALGHVGIVLGLEVSRLARNNADWYRLLDLCGLTSTLLADEDGVYDPSVFNDRLVLGLKRPAAYLTPFQLRGSVVGSDARRAAVPNWDRACLVPRSQLWRRQRYPTCTLVKACPNAVRHPCSLSRRAISA